MGTSSGHTKPVKTSHSRRRERNAKAKVTKSSNKAGGGQIGVKIKQSDKRCLNAASLAESRLEILSMLDFKPLKSAQNQTLAGKLFDLRLIERDADLESVNVAMNKLVVNAEYTEAILKYESVVTATKSEFALLKILILLQKYATHTSRFLPFINEYELPDDLDLSFLGDSNLEILNAVTSVDLEEAINNSEATRVLIQILVMLNCATIGISPYNLNQSPVNIETLPSNMILTKFVAKDEGFDKALYDLAYLSRDLTFSREMTRLRDNQEPDEEYMQLIEDILGKSFFSSSREVDDSPMAFFIGTNAFTNLRKGTNRQTMQATTKVDQFLRAQKGVISQALYNPSKRQRILLPETTDITYGWGFNTIEQIVDKVFSGPKVLDFSEYSEIIENFVNSIEQANKFGKTSFRLMEAASESDGESQSPPVVAEEQPLSMPSIAAVTLDVFNRRFASTLKNALYTPFYDWLTPEHISYTRIFAWMLIRDNPDLAKLVVSGFLADYDDGFVTAASVPEPIEGSAELDDDGNEIEGTEQMSEVSYVLPGTTTQVNLSGRAARLNSMIARINRYYNDEVDPMTPNTVISSLKGEGLSFPEIRTSYNRQEPELADYFGLPNPTETNPDLRLINVMTINQVTTILTSSTSNEKNYYLSTKIIAAEIIDAVLEVLRLFITPFSEVAPAEDGDPVFPFISEMKNPYGDAGTWCYSGAGYGQFSMNQWVSTCSEWHNLFARSTDKVTYFRRATLKENANRVIEIFNYLMQAYNFIIPETETLSTTTINTEISATTEKDWVPLTATIKFVPTEVRKEGWQVNENSSIGSHITALSEIIDGLLEANFDDFDTTVDEIKSTLPSGEATTVEVSSTQMTKSLPPSPGGFGSSTEPVDLDTSPTKSSVSETGRETYTPDVPPSQPALEAWAKLLEGAKQEDVILSFFYDFIGQYGSRVENYMNATLDLISGEGAPLGDLITSLKDSGDAGTDVLQNLSVNQMALKQIALEEEEGDAENGYLPKLSILNDSERDAVRVLCEEPILQSPEGDTNRVIIVGLPIGLFDRNEIDSEFCLRVSYRDIEYPQLVFMAKSFKFDKDLYILPEDLEDISEGSTGFSNIVDNMSFSKIRVEVVESDDVTASIELIDDVQKLSVDNDNRSVYVNLAVSEVLKMYYRIMLGLNFSESVFQSTPEGLNIPISESSAALASSMTMQIESISTYSSGLASNINSLLNDITKFENPDDFVTGEITPVDIALLGDLKNAYQSRLFSPEVLRERAISAKMFDRVYALPVDPDEFYVVAPGEAQVGSVETPQEIFDFYLKSGIIEEEGNTSAGTKYKLAPRKSGEGSMAMGSVTVVITSVDDSAEEILGL